MADRCYCRFSSDGGITNFYATGGRLGTNASSVDTTSNIGLIVYCSGNSGVFCDPLPFWVPFERSKSIVLRGTE